MRAREIEQQILRVVITIRDAYEDWTPEHQTAQGALEALSQVFPQGDTAMTHKIQIAPCTFVNLSAEHWQLYEMPGCEEAAREINQACNEAITEAFTQIMQGEDHNKAVIDAMVKVRKTLSKFSNFGAMDTEPRWNAEAVIKKAIYGKDWRKIDSF